MEINFKSKMVDNNRSDFFKRYEESISNNFLCPSDIPRNKMKDAFNNLFKGKPQKKNMEGEFTKIITNKKEVLSDNNKIKESLTSSEEGKLANNYTTDEKLSNKESNPDKTNIKFGQHSVYSLFEYYARDIIYQLFDYHPMYYYNYKFTMKNKKEEEKKEEGKNININNIIDKNPDLSNKDNENSDANIKININKDNSKSKNFNEIKKDFMLSHKEIKKNEKSKKSKKSKNEDILYHGDFDFVMPNVSVDELNKVLNNTEIAPFIFHGNINNSLKYDIIGEIKENINEGQRNIEQINKYISLIKLIRFNKDANENVGLNFENEKIMLYVFNTGYHKFLFKMIEYKKHYEKFESVDEKFRNDHYKKIISLPRKFKAEIRDEQNADLINIIINSSIPYIFIYVPSVSDVISKVQKKDPAIDDLNSRLTELEKKVKEMEIKYEKKNSADDSYYCLIQ